ncbi:MAG: oligosaccharide flippase family protein, partial [Candidatus Omnitrophica bacterium]|nr:oligosaccharide flippase family protein [Candidatus Omnitrophota bacterium]
RAALTIYVLIFVSPTVTAYLTCFLISAVLEVAVLGGVVWKALPPPQAARSRLDFALLGRVWKFTALLTATGILIAMVEQLDKLLISKILPLGLMGYYTVAAQLAAALTFITIPVFYTVYPRFSALLAEHKTDDLRKVYRRASQLAALLTWPATGTLIFFSRDILLLWTHSEALARETWLVLSFLVIGYQMRALAMFVPHALQIAADMLKLPFYANLIGWLLLVPSMIFGIHYWQMRGAACVWALFNFLYFLIVPRIMHRRLLEGNIAGWFLKDILPYAAVGLVVPAFFRMLACGWQASWAPYLWIGLSPGVSYLTVLLMYPPSRDMVFRFFSPSKIHS